MYDLIIIGAGAAGLAASIYASRYKIKHLIFGEKVGGQFVDAAVIENYPGFLSISGWELTQKFQEQVESYGIRIENETVGDLQKLAEGFEITTKAGNKYQSKTVILAMGGKHRQLNVPGEDKFLGRGVSYCATCDAPLFRQKKVAVIGGGDSGAMAALHTAAYADQVYLVQRGTLLTAEPIWIERLNQAIAQDGKIKLVLGNQVKEIEGEQFVERLVLTKPFEGSNTLTVQGVLIEIGLVPISSLAKRLGAELNNEGYIKIAPDYSTSIAGLFAVGDIAHLPGSLHFSQILTSAAQGALATVAVYRFLHQHPPGPERDGFRFLTI